MITSGVGQVLSICLIISIGVVIRVQVNKLGVDISSPYYYEVNTPLNSINRIREGIFFQEFNKSPYQGTLYCNVPFYLILYGVLIKNNLLFAFFNLVDSLAAIALYCSIIVYRKKLIDGSFYCTDIRSFTQNIIDYIPIFTAIFYLWNPLTVFSSLACSTQSITNLFVILMCLFALLSNTLLTSIFMAISIHLDPYILALLVPTVLVLCWSKSKTFYSKLFNLTVLTLFFEFIFFISSGYYEGWWKKYYGLIFFVPEIQPSIGIFWFFFAQVFARFRYFYLYFFQYHIFIYPIPICIWFKKHPFFAWWVVLSMVSILKSYPSVSDVALFLAFIPFFYELAGNGSNGIVVGFVAVILMFIFPVVRNWWIFYGVLNSVYYYGLNLALNIDYTLLISSMMSSVMKAEYLLNKRVQ